jgi:mannose-6-phosphate isomerase-like protein (cupin superfamily)
MTATPETPGIPDAAPPGAGGPRDVVLGPEEGARVEVLGARVTLKATSADTGGAYGCLEYIAPPAYAGPPPHWHRAMEEIFVVLEGELTLRLGEREVVAGPGAFVQVARGTAHTFANRGAGPVRFLGLVVPGGWEGYFAELPGLVAAHSYPPPPAVMAELMARYDVVPVPPPVPGTPAGAPGEESRT